jgi:hypothetical protein
MYILLLFNDITIMKLTPKTLLINRMNKLVDTAQNSATIPTYKIYAVVMTKIIHQKKNPNHSHAVNQNLTELNVFFHFHPSNEE